MNYKKYQEARNAAWEMLIDFKISELPVKISEILEALKIPMITYADNAKAISKYKLEQIASESDGFTIRNRGKHVIFYDSAKPPERIRFTLAHELGHIICNHVGEGAVTTRNTEPSENDSEDETQANIFAIRLLAPACVLHELRLFNVDAIAETCQISRKSAEFRYERLMLLEKRDEEFKKTRGRGCFYMSPLERQVYQQFKGYIFEKTL